MNIVWVDNERWQYFKQYANTEFKGHMFLPIALKDAIENPSKVNLIYGSKFSAKTETWARYKLKQLTEEEHTRTIFARRTQTQAKNNTFQLLQDIVNNPQLDWRKQFEINLTKMKITCKKTGNFMVGGSFQEPDNIMGAANVTDLWVDEPITWKGSIKQEDFETIQGSFRNDRGIKSVFTFTTNPIGKNNFIYKGIVNEDTRQYEDVRITLMNYPDNPFIPIDNLEYLNDLKKRNFERWLVEGQGEWGEPQNKLPFFGQFMDMNVAPANHDPDSKLILSFDFNVRNNQVIIGQKTDEGIRIIANYKAPGYIGNLCDLLLNKQWLFENKRGMIVTGDASGKSGHSSAKVSSYETIRTKLRLSKASMKVPKGNLGHLESRAVCNDMLFRIPTYIDPRCIDLIEDLRKAKPTKDGKLLKDDKNYFMDAADAFRYFVRYCFPKAGVADVLRYETIIRNMYPAVVRKYNEKRA